MNELIIVLILTVLVIFFILYYRKNRIVTECPVDDSERYNIASILLFVKDAFNDILKHKVCFILSETTYLECHAWEEFKGILAKQQYGSILQQAVIVN